MAKNILEQTKSDIHQEAINTATQFNPNTTLNSLEGKKIFESIAHLVDCPQCRCVTALSNLPR